MEKFFTRLSQTIAELAGTSYAFGVALGFILIWACSGPIFGFSDTWQLVINTATTIITFLMVFLIQNSQNRDSTAVEAKLDEVIRCLEGARSQLIGIEHLTESEVEAIRTAIEDENGDQTTKVNVEELLRNATRRAKQYRPK
ncbi:low affinity iron permease family protein [Ochrobactrum teleogrylli]|uniref:Low affinity iron permease family protein n=1 Tax=Ochrobactrum teleogrylli TaxID=2479765 RepID=A0ABY2Y2W0_9HYPH|nr:low affinity iron permease family protein [[Ochrobactrum] teleogrylli]TNV12328.1 low affinity iron permease family protein [[Ochrobactrum] teleogrylli]